MCECVKHVISRFLLQKLAIFSKKRPLVFQFGSRIDIYDGYVASSGFPLDLENLENLEK